jgi:hypothetical protein
MNGPEQLGGNMIAEDKKKRAAAYEAALTRLRQRPEVKQGEDTRAVELTNHGIDPTQTPPPPSRIPFKSRLVTVGGVRVPSTPPQKPGTEVEQPELIRDKDGKWVRKDTE